VERHKAAELNRQLLQRAIVQKVKHPRRNLHPSTNSGMLGRRSTTPLNFTLSKVDPDGLPSSVNKNGQPIGTISLEELDHLIARLVEFRMMSPVEEAKGEREAEY